MKRTDMGSEQQDPYTKQRVWMVESQIRARGVRDERVLAVMTSVPRHEFVDKGQLSLAYADRPLPIGFGQTISQPYIVAKMLVLAGVQPSDRVLELGTGSGYQTALLAELAHQVYSIERIPELSDVASRRIEQMGYDNVSIKAADGTVGWGDEAPFDRMLVSAGAPGVPGPLLEQLALGGRIVIPVGNKQYQILTVVHKDGAGRVRQEHHDDCRFVDLIGRHGWEE